jgi:phosphoenolpyruvate phosphomutase / 2-hydroxyethylphosphonate cytidylyltransferase
MNEELVHVATPIPKTVYVPMAVDLLHHGHMNIINEARKLGSVTIGLLSDKAIASYKRLPMLTFEQRKKIIQNIVGVDAVVEQKEHDYESILRQLRPDFVVHGDDWKKGVQRDMRTKVVDLLKEWNGALVEPAYTNGVSSTKLINASRARGVTASIRGGMLRRLIEAKPIVRIIEAHNGLTGLIAEKTSHQGSDGEIRTFDGMWLSSLTHSTSKGKPDTQLVNITQMDHTVSEIFEVTTKPMIVDADSGGMTEHFRFTVRTLERLGVSAVIIEDKTGAKRNSLFGTDLKQTQDTIENFAHKISEGKKAQVGEDFMIIARIESLILKQGQEDALQRARAYINAGVDALMIHSKEKHANEILDFCNAYKEFDVKVPLVVVPSTYSHITEQELIAAGVNVVIYANHLLRSAYPAMMNTAYSILQHTRCHEASENCMGIKEILTLIPTGEEE